MSDPKEQALRQAVLDAAELEWLEATEAYEALVAACAAAQGPRRS